MITGPGSPGILTNFPGCIEQNVNWIADVMIRMRDTNAVEIEASEAAESQWAQDITDVANGTLMTTVDSWYMNTNIAGKPRVFSAYFSGMNTYAEVCADVAKDGYRGFEIRNRKMVDVAA